MFKGAEFLNLTSNSCLVPLYANLSPSGILWVLTPTPSQAHLICPGVCTPGKGRVQRLFPVHWLPGVQAALQAWFLPLSLFSLRPQPGAACQDGGWEQHSSAFGGSWVCLPNAVGARWTRQNQSGPVSPCGQVQPLLCYVFPAGGQIVWALLRPHVEVGAC